MRCRAHRGFTLVEILVVVAIIGIAAGVATVAFERDERAELAREARRLGGAVEYAAARARMRGETLGISAEDNGWRFWSRGADARWQPLQGDDALAAHPLRAPITGRALSYAGAPLPPDAIIPLRASGRNEPFTILIATPRWQTIVSTDLLNRVAIADPAPAAP